MLNRYYALTMTAAILGAASAHAVTLSSFETGTEGFNSSATLASSTIGATDGTKSLAITYTGFAWVESSGDSNAIMQANADALLASTDKKLYIDFTVDSPGVGAWANALLSFNDADGWRQLANAVDIPTSVGTHTVAIDYSELAMPNYAGGNWFKYSFSVNGPATAASPLTIYVDNIRVESVPEPASMAALGLGVAAIVRKRRARR